jgi:hypothetical protein
MSALPPEADIRQRIEHVCFVPIADIVSGPPEEYFRGLRSALLLTGRLDP